MALWEERNHDYYTTTITTKYTITTYITLTTKSKAQQMICMNCWSMTVHFFSCKSLSLSPPPIFLSYMTKTKQKMKTYDNKTKTYDDKTLTKKTGDNWHWIF